MNSKRKELDEALNRLERAHQRLVAAEADYRDLLRAQPGSDATLEIGAAWLRSLEERQASIHAERMRTEVLVEEVLLAWSEVREGCHAED